MKPEAMTTALLVIAALALVCEIVGLLYCSIRNIPFGRAFGLAVFTQLIIPAALIAVGFVWERFSPSTGGLEPFGVVKNCQGHEDGSAERRGFAGKP